jgi:hypothetical protein
MYASVWLVTVLRASETPIASAAPTPPNPPASEIAPARRLIERVF